MSVVKELIRTEADGSISFGNYELDAKTKLADFKHGDGVYKVKTFREITRLEKNDKFVYESVPGTAVTSLFILEGGMEFMVEGLEDIQITLELEPSTVYDVIVGALEAGEIKTNLGGKLSFGVELDAGVPVQVKIKKA